MPKSKSKSPAKQASAIQPDQLKVNQIQAERLASLTRLNAKELVGQTHVELSDRLKWVLDPHLLFFRKICGRVVKKDPVTGVDLPGAQRDGTCGGHGLRPGRVLPARFEVRVVLSALLPPRDACHGEDR